MCLIAFALGIHPQFPLVLAANRDEFYERPTARAAWWPEAADVHGGRDLSAGGSWLAINRQGRLAALTNVRDGFGGAGRHSRGALVAAQFGVGGETAPQDFSRVADWGRDYAGFNLLRIDLHRGAGGRLTAQADWCSNRRGTGHDWVEGGQAASLPSGLHTLSNALIDVPWPKSQRLAAALERSLRSEAREALIEALLTALDDHRAAPDAALPETGVGLARERMLSSVFIAGDGYGTRTSTVIVVDHAGRVDFVERDATPGALPPARIASHFDLTA